MRTMHIKSLALLSFLILGLGACSQTYTVGGKDGATATVSGDGQNGSVTVKSSDGKNAANMTMGSSAVYPPDMPFPQYPGSKISMVLDQSGMANGAKCTSVTLESSDGLDKISGHYKSWFGSNGWTISSESNVSGVGTLIAKKDSLNASIMMMPGTAAGATNIQITLSSDK